MFIHRQDLHDIFDEQFILMDGQYYFTSKHTDWMLPVTKEEYSRSTRIFKVWSVISMILTWLGILGALFFLFYRFLSRTFITWDFLTAALIALAPAIFHLLAMIIPTRALVKRLRRLIEDNDPIMASLLTKKHREGEQE